MNIKTFIFPGIYSTLCIISICIAFYGGYSQHINKVSIIGWLLIIPFCVMAMVYSKKTLFNNNIGGKDAVKEGFKFIVFSTIILVIFQAIFFTMDFKAYKRNDMSSTVNVPKSAIPITERYNPLSSHLDGSLSAAEFVR